MKSDKVPSLAKVAPKPTPFAVKTYSPAKSNETARAGSCLLEGVDACAKFIDDIKGVKTAILVAESMLLDQDDAKVAKEVAKTMAAEAYSSAENIKKLEYELF
ncbi:hypothetical protein FF2_040617 [Malus domestica]